MAKNDILLPLHKKWADLIFAGEKTVELRKVRPKCMPRKLLIYETAPVSAIVGEAKVLWVAHGPQASMYPRHHKAACITWEEWAAYFGKGAMCTAFELFAPVRYKEPLPWEGPPPQGMQYVPVLDEA